MQIRTEHRRAGIALVAAVAILAGIAAAVADNDNPALGRRVAGTWFVVEQGSGTDEFLTLYADGNVLLNSSAEGRLDFGSSQGVWERRGPREIALWVANFDFDDDGIAVVRFTIEFDADFVRMTGLFAGSLYPRGTDPLDPGDTEPLFSFEDVIDGRRVTVD